MRGARADPKASKIGHYGYIVAADDSLYFFWGSVVEVRELEAFVGWAEMAPEMGRTMPRLGFGMGHRKAAIRRLRFPRILRKGTDRRIGVKNGPSR